MAKRHADHPREGFNSNNFENSVSGLVEKLMPEKTRSLKDAIFHKVFQKISKQEIKKGCQATHKYFSPSLKKLSIFEIKIPEKEGSINHIGLALDRTLDTSSDNAYYERNIINRKNRKKITLLQLEKIAAQVENIFSK